MSTKKTLSIFLEIIFLVFGLWISAYQETKAGDEIYCFLKSGNCVSNYEPCIFCSSYTDTCTVNASNNNIDENTFSQLSSCATGGNKCQTGACPSNNTNLSNGDSCQVRKYIGEVKVGNGLWDLSDTKCVDCTLDNVELVSCGDASDIYLTEVPLGSGNWQCFSAGDGKFESACGADAACDEKAVGAACSPPVGGTCSATGLCVAAACADADADGFTDIACGGTDCDDTNPNIYPGAPEVCGNAIDEDCSGADILCNKWLCDTGTTSDCAAPGNVESCAGLDGDACVGGTWNCPGTCKPNCNAGFPINTCATIAATECFDEYASCDCDCVPAVCVPATCVGCADGTLCPGGTCSGGACVPAGPGAISAPLCQSALIASDVGKLCGVSYIVVAVDVGSWCCSSANGVALDQTICQAMDPACAGGGAEICTGGADEDGDLDVDCADSDCAADPACVAIPPAASCSGPGMFVSPLGPGYCTIGEILTKATNWILALVSSIIILIIIIGGLMYISSAGDEEKLRTSKNIIFYAIVGLGIILISYALITEVTDILKGP